jgi:hypothetical protein
MVPIFRSKICCHETITKRVETGYRLWERELVQNVPSWSSIVISNPGFWGAHIAFFLWYGEAFETSQSTSWYRRRVLWRVVDEKCYTTCRGTPSGHIWFWILQELETLGLLMDTCGRAQHLLREWSVIVLNWVNQSEVTTEWCRSSCCMAVTPQGGQSSLPTDCRYNKFNPLTLIRLAPKTTFHNLSSPKINTCTFMA